jgi:HPt (histidine-containing phosphotransfer) domain-containing protein
VGVFVKGIPPQLKNLREAVAGGDSAAARHQAHTIKGAAANIGAEPVREAAWELEQAVSGGDREKVRACAIALEMGLETLKGHLKSEFGLS